MPQVGKGCKERENLYRLIIRLKHFFALWLFDLIMYNNTNLFCFILVSCFMMDTKL